MLVPHEVVLERVEQLVGELVVPVLPVVSLWTRSWVGGSVLTIMVGETNLTSRSTVMKILTSQYISTIPCASSLRFHIVQFGARGVVDPDLLPPFGRVGNVMPFSIKSRSLGTALPDSLVDVRFLNQTAESISSAHKRFGKQA